jgi:predicted alpha/beta-fold hydrolase
MPLVANSSYRAPWYLLNGHLETIVPSMVRKIKGVTYDRERLELSDGDFIDLDWLRNKSNKLIIIAHGLEGNSDRHYSKGMAKYFFQRGWNTLAWNCRSCSGEMNRLPRFYHHGATEDLAELIAHVIAKKQFEKIVLVGFSMGGSLTLKYLGEQRQLPKEIKAGVVFSVPCHLGSSAKELDKPSKKFYLNRFLKKLGKKIKVKSELFPDLISYHGYEAITTFEEFDNRYTAPLHGFKNADDFYLRASSLNYISTITLPTLIVNALNDPFLPPLCFPTEIAKDHSHLFLETPERGGHTGFTLAGKKENWMEVRAFEFISQQL